MTNNQLFGLLVLPLSLIQMGCVQMDEIKPTLNPAQQAYTDKVLANSLDVAVPKSQVEEAWGRTQSFIGQYSDLKLQVVTDYTISTYNSDHIYSYAYTATKILGTDPTVVTIRVSCDSWTSPYYQNDVLPKANLNAHILSDYLRTGALPFPELISH